MTFKEYIISKGVRQNHLAEQLGLAENTFLRKLDGSREFKVSEIQQLAGILRMNKDEIVEIFFPELVS